MKRRIIELSHEECYQTWRALKIYLAEMETREPTQYSGIAGKSLTVAMGKIQNYLTKDFAGEHKGLLLENSVETLPPYELPLSA